MLFSCWGWDRIGWAVTSMFIADCWICHCFHQHEDVAILRSFIMIYDYSPDSPSSTNTYLVHFVKKTLDSLGLSIAFAWSSARNLSSTARLCALALACPAFPNLCRCWKKPWTTSAARQRWADRPQAPAEKSAHLGAFSRDGKGSSPPSNACRSECGRRH